MTDKEAAILTISLLGAAILASPDGKVQQAFTKMVNDMRGAGEAEKQIAVCITASIYDGLLYGNWPS